MRRIHGEILAALGHRRRRWVAFNSNVLGDPTMDLSRGNFQARGGGTLLLVVLEKTARRVDRLPLPLVATTRAALRAVWDSLYPGSSGIRHGLLKSFSGR